ncbi:MAG: hypothetical protein E7532_05585 [Ruminococcaceae bacterium]|nr:hypothetical protein [Oscillospiraceae bacterium]
MYNQYDLSQIYGVPINTPRPLPGETLQNTLSERIPSLEELAGYNNQQQSLNQNIIDVPQILQNQNTVAGLKPAPERLDTIPINNNLSQLTPSIGTENTEGIEYLNGLIRTQIGRRASIDFLLGTSGMVTKDGYILGVGSNYILINEVDTDDITACDFYNIKFIRFFY